MLNAVFLGDWKDQKAKAICLGKREPLHSLPLNSKEPKQTQTAMLRTGSFLSYRGIPRI